MRLAAARAPRDSKRPGASLERGSRPPRRCRRYPPPIDRLRGGTPRARRRQRRLGTGLHRLVELRSGEINAAQIRPEEGCRGEISAFRAGIREAGALEQGVAKRGPLEIAVRENLRSLMHGVVGGHGRRGGDGVTPSARRCFEISIPTVPWKLGFFETRPRRTLADMKRTSKRRHQRAGRRSPSAPIEAPISPA